MNDRLSVCKRINKIYYIVLKWENYVHVVCKRCRIFSVWPKHVANDSLLSTLISIKYKRFFLFKFQIYMCVFVCSVGRRLLFVMISLQQCSRCMRAWWEFASGTRNQLAFWQRVYLTVKREWSGLPLYFDFSGSSFYFVILFIPLWDRKKVVDTHTLINFSQLS